MRDDHQRTIPATRLTELVFASAFVAVSHPLSSVLLDVSSTGSRSTPPRRLEYLLALVLTKDDCPTALRVENI